MNYEPVKRFRETLKTCIELLRERDLLIYNIIVFLSGFALGALLFFSVVYTKVNFTFKPDTLGIISLTTIYEYPNQMKSILYVTGVSSLIFSSVVVWLVWVLIASLYAAVTKADSKGFLKLSVLSYIPLFVSLLGTIPDAAKGLKAAGTAALEAVFIYVLIAITCYVKDKKSKVKNQESGDEIHRTEDREQKTGDRFDYQPSTINLRLWDFLLAPVVILVLIYDPNFLNWIKVDYTFFGEEGQHLAWANRILHGQFPNKDMFNLYGPLYEYGYAAAMKLFGVSLASFRICNLIYDFLGLFCLYTFLRIAFRSRLFAILTFLVIFEHIWFQLRIGLGFLSLAFLIAFLKGDLTEKKWLYLAGIAAGVSLLYSQEIGISVFIATVAVLTIVVTGRRFNAGYRSFLFYGSGIATILIPFAVYFAVNGALWKALSTLIEYPSYAAAGYAALPYPSIMNSIPPGFSFKAYIDSVFNIFGPFEAFYAPGLYALVGAYLAVRVFLKKWGRDEMLLSALFVFGVFSFNTALGRSDGGHIQFTLPAAVILFFIFVEKISFIVKEETAGGGHSTEGRGLLAVFIPMLLIIASIYGMSSVIPAVDKLYSRYKQGYGREPEGYVPSDIERLKGILVPKGSLDTVEKVTDYIISHTSKDDGILSIPNNAAYYFLTDRMNPTRFDLFGQIVTDSHRLEVVEDTKREKPLYVIYDMAIPPVDGIPDKLQFPQAMAYIKENYTLKKRFGRTLILRRLNSPSPLRGQFISDRLNWGKERDRFFAYFWNQPALYQYDLDGLDEKALFHFLNQKNIRTAYVFDFYLAERLTRQSGERLIFSPPYGERLSGYAAIVDSDPSHAFIFTGDEGYNFDFILGQAAASFKKDKAGGFTVYHSIRPSSYNFKAVSPDGWKASSSLNHESTGKAFDRDVNTRWVTGKNQEPGMWYQLDMGRIHEINRITAIQGSMPPDSPRGFEILISADGKTWNRISENRSFKGISAYIDGGILKLDPSGNMDVVFPAMKARYIKIIQIGSDPLYNWSIAEMFVYRKAGGKGQGELNNLYKSAGHDVAAKNYDLAVKKYYEVISRYPDHDAAHHAVNMILMRIGLSPDRSQYEKGGFFEDRGMWNSALIEYEKALRGSVAGYSSDIIERIIHISTKLDDHKRASSYRERLKKDFAPQMAINGNFGGKIEFIGYDIKPLRVKAGGRLMITYFWRCLKEMKDDYAIFVHILKDGKIALQNDHYPLDKGRMTGDWRQGEMIREAYEIAVPENVEKGIYRIRLGVWDPVKSKRLKIISASVPLPSEKDGLFIGEIKVD